MSRTDARVQFLQPRVEGQKPTNNMLMLYQSGQSNAPEYQLIVANHYNSLSSDAQWTGRITFSVTDAYWQSSKLQAQETANSDPLSLGMDVTTDVAYAQLHGFTIESIPPGAYRVLKLRINGTSLTFADVLEKITLNYPTGA